jgi:hypothetical protein
MAAIALSTSLALRGAASFAQSDDPRAVEARRACAAGEVDRGIKLLADILATTDDAMAIYNMGRCYQQNGMADRAALQFREYLRKAKDLTPDERREVEAQLKELEADEKATRPMAPPAVAAKLPSVVAAVPAEPTHHRDESKRKRRLAGIGVGSLGIVSLGAGVFFGLRASSLQSQNEKAGNMFQLADDKAGPKAVTLQWVFLGVGTAAVAGGALLYYLGLDEEHAVAVLPTFGPGEVGAVMRGRL